MAGLERIETALRQHPEGFSPSRSIFATTYQRHHGVFSLDIDQIIRRAEPEFRIHINRMLHYRTQRENSPQRQRALSFLFENISPFARFNTDVPIYSPYVLPPARTLDLTDLLQHPEMMGAVIHRETSRRKRRQKPAENQLVVEAVRTDQSPHDEKRNLMAMYNLPEEFFDGTELNDPTKPLILIHEIYTYTAPPKSGQEIMEWNIHGSYLLGSRKQPAQPELFFLGEEANDPHKHIPAGDDWARITPQANPQSFTAKDLRLPALQLVPHNRVATQSQIATILALLQLSVKPPESSLPPQS